MTDRAPIPAGAYDVGDVVRYVGPTHPDRYGDVGPVVMLYGAGSPHIGLWVELPPGGVENTMLIRSAGSVELVSRKEG